MGRLVEKFWFFTAALCLMTTLSAVVVMVGNHENSEERSSESVELEELEVLNERQVRSYKRELKAAFRCILDDKSSDKINRFHSFARVERDELNGFGGNLRT